MPSGMLYNAKLTVHHLGTVTGEICTRFIEQRTSLTE